MTEDIIAPVALRKAKRAVVKVGNGRGFVVGTPRARFIITAAHCVPRKRYPHPNLANSVHELTLPWMIGPLGSKRANLPIWSELCHLSLIDDIAVLGAPDNQTLCDEY